MISRLTIVTKKTYLYTIIELSKSNFENMENQRCEPLAAYPRYCTCFSSYIQSYMLFCVNTIAHAFLRTHNCTMYNIHAILRTCNCTCYSSKLLVIHSLFCKYLNHFLTCYIFIVFHFSWNML